MGFIKFYFKELFKSFLNFIFTISMPTLIYAKYKKDIQESPRDISKFIIKINTYNFIFALIGFIILGILDFILKENFITDFPKGINIILFICGVLLIWFAISRCLEIFYAFYRDSISQLKSIKNSSDLKYFERIKLAMTSYAELIINYAIIYYVYAQFLVANDIQIDEFKISNIIDSIYYSIVTITTLGYGDLHPMSGSYSIPIQILSVAEVINGFILIIVSFTIYVSKSIDNKESEKDFKKDNKYLERNSLP
jgi:voltage-gated potassium channel